MDGKEANVSSGVDERCEWPLGRQTNKILTRDRELSDPLNKKTNDVSSTLCVLFAPTVSNTNYKQ